jgi:hypothetical protein
MSENNYSQTYLLPIRLVIHEHSPYALEVHQQLSGSRSHGLEYVKMYVSDTYHTKFMSFTF